MKALQKLFIFYCFHTTLFCTYPTSNLVLNGNDPGICKITTKGVETSLKINHLPSLPICISLEQKWNPTFFMRLMDPEEMINRCQTVSNFCKDHCIEVTALALLSSYVWITFQIQKTSALLQDTDAWCNWQSNASIFDLKMQSKQELLNQFKKDFHAKYIKNAASPSSCDFMTLFVTDIKNELLQLDTYTKWYQRTEKVFCNKLFDFLYDIACIEEKKVRLFFIIDICKTVYSYQPN